MKHLSFLSLGIILMVSLASCSKDKSGPGEPSKPEAQGIKAATMNTRAVLSWTNPTEGDFEKLNVIVETKEATSKIIVDTLLDKVTELKVASLEPSTEYKCTIRTRDGSGNGSEGTQFEFTTESYADVALQKLSEANAPLWSIAGFSSQEQKGDNGSAKNIIDGKDGTFWLSVWNDGDFAEGVTSGSVPQYVIIDLKKEVVPTEIILYRRNNVPGGPAKVKIETTEQDPASGAVTWRDRGTSDLKGGTDNGPLPCLLWELTPARYVKITVLTVASGNLAQVREVDVMTKE